MKNFKTLVQNHEEMGGKSWNIGFLNDGRDDETQFDLALDEGVEELYELWVDFCRTENIDPDAVEYVEEAKPDMSLKRYSELCDASETLCRYCDNDNDCDFCQVAALINNAYDGLSERDKDSLYT